MLRKLFVAITVCTAYQLLAQAPGGVSSNLTAWYRANVASTVVGSPGPVSAWNNSGGSATGYNLSQFTASKRPGFLDGSTNYKQYNYNPRIDFKSASFSSLENTGYSPDLYGTAGTIFLVTNQKPLGTDGSGLTYSSDIYQQRIQMKPAFRIQTSTGYTGYTADFAPPLEYTTADASMFTLSRLGSLAVHRLNSVPFNCSNCGDDTYNPWVARGLYLGRNGTGGEHVDCDMGEVIFYSNTLTTSQIDRVETYLAIKYGITRGGNTGTAVTYNYVSSAGAVIWNKTRAIGSYAPVGRGMQGHMGLIRQRLNALRASGPCCFEPRIHTDPHG